MIDASMIPDEVVEAAAKSMGWPSAIVFPQDKLRFKGHLAAALNAWPEARRSIERKGSYPVIILPLLKEGADE
jgi:hypothetical protein